MLNLKIIQSKLYWALDNNDTYAFLMKKGKNTKYRERMWACKYVWATFGIPKRCHSMPLN